MSQKSTADIDSKKKDEASTMDVKEAKTKSPAKKAARKSRKKTEKNPDTKQIVFDASEDIEVIVSQALDDKDILATLIDSLSGDKRRTRQFSATTISAISHEKPEVLVPYVGMLCDSLHRPEAQTRWEILEALHELIPLCRQECILAIPGAESSLYDESSSIVRFSAFRFLCAVGASGQDLSEEVWPNIDEAIQCYHGDPEFQDMLTELIAFSQGDIGDGVKESLASRMKFDADNGKGQLRRKATVIVSSCV